MRKEQSGGSWWWAAMAAFMVGTVGAACAGKQTPRDSITDPGESIFNGYVVSGVECYKCHNADGKGTWRGANLADNVPKMTDQAVANAIKEGPGLMPAFKDKLSDQQIAALTAWLRGRFH